MKSRNDEIQRPLRSPGMVKKRCGACLAAGSAVAALCLGLCLGGCLARAEAGLPEGLPPASAEAGGEAAIGWLVVTLAAVALAVERIMALVRGFRRMPPVEDEFVRKEAYALHEKQIAMRVTALEASHARLSERLTEALAHVESSGEARAEKIHARINLILEKVSHIEGKLSLGRQS